MLGFWAAIARVVSREAMRQSVADSVPPKTIDINMRAFDTGYERGQQLAASIRDPES
jgi:2-oxoglutarate ferredoxin oxidoreductase subunit gamma